MHSGSPRRDVGAKTGAGTAGRDQEDVVGAANGGELAVGIGRHVVLRRVLHHDPGRL